MAPENVKVVGALYEAVNCRAFDDALRCVHPNLELYPGIEVPDHDAPYLGHHGFKKFLEAVTDVWETVTILPTEAIETEDGRILAIDRWRFRGRDGIEIDRELPTLYAFREGLIVRIDGFTDQTAAVKAAGL